MFRRVPLLQRLVSALRVAWLVPLVLDFGAVAAQAARADSVRGAQWKASLGAEHHLAGTWQMKDGLPSDRIRAIVQSRSGYLWIGTTEGLVRFDGVRFRVFDIGNRSDLKNNFITHLFEDSAGRLWLAHDNGEVSIYAGGVFESLPLEDAWKERPVTRILEDRAGTVWLLGSRGLLRGVKAGRPGPVLPRITPSFVRTLTLDQEGRVWAASMNRVFELSEGVDISAATQEEATGLLRPLAFPARAGGLWIASQGLIRRWHRGAWTGDEIVSGLDPQTYFTTGHETASGAVVIGTIDKGLLIFSRTGDRQRVTGEAQLQTRSIESVCEDREGNLWIGTSADGLGLLRPKRVSMLDLPGNEHKRRIIALLASRQGGLWIGSDGSGLYRLRGDTLRHFTMRDGLANNLVPAFVEDDAGVLWIAEGGGTVQRFDGQSFENAARIPTLTPVRAFIQEDRESFWVGGQTVARLHRDGTLRPIESEPGERPATVHCLARTSDGTLWIGTRNEGLVRYARGALTRFGAAQGLPGNQIWALHAETDGTLWVSAYGHGIARIRDGRITPVPTDAGLPNVICHIIDDTKGNFWLSSNRGIFRVARADLEACTDGRIDRVPALVLDINDGLSSLDMVGGQQAAGCRTEDGRIWFATAKGVAMVDPANVRAPPADPLVTIEDVRIDGRAHDLEAKRHLAPDHRPVVEIAPGSHAIDIDYAGLSFAAPNRLQFRYRFEGRDREWTDAGTRRTAYFWNLPPGDYTFRVMAGYGQHDWKNEASIDLKVLPFFWQTTWFAVVGFVSAAFAVGGVALGAAHRANRKRLAELERQRAIERDRTRIAHDLHDDVGAGLTQLTLLAHSTRQIVTGSDKAIARLDEMRGAIHRMTESLDEIVWAVNPQNDSLDSLVTYLGRFIQDFLHRGGISCKLNFPFELEHLEMPAEVRHALYLAVREALHNILRHSGATEVRVALSSERDDVLFRIEDNGRGFSNAAGTTAADATPRLSQGLGLQSMTQRLREIGGECAYGNRPEGGAFVSFRLRLAQRHHSAGS